MRTITLTLWLLSISCGLLRGQSYIPTATAGKTFYVHNYTTFLGNSTLVYAVRGDTVQQGKSYPLLVRQDSAGSVLDTIAILREDSSQQTLLIEYLDSNTPTATLDFSVQAGDTLFIPSFAMAPDSNPLVVDSITTYLDQQNISRRHFHGSLQGNALTAQVEWIEGLGSLRGMGWPYPVVDVIVEAFPFLACVFDQNSTQLFRNPSATEACFFLSQSDYSRHKTSLYPQPARDILTLESSRALRGFTIIDSQGRPLKEGRLDANRSSHTLSVNDLSPGVYFLQIWDQQGQRETRKIMLR